MISVIDTLQTIIPFPTNDDQSFGGMLRRLGFDRAIFECALGALLRGTTKAKLDIPIPVSRDTQPFDSTHQQHRIPELQQQSEIIFINRRKLRMTCVANGVDAELN